MTSSGLAGSTTRVTVLCRAIRSIPALPSISSQKRVAYAAAAASWSPLPGGVLRCHRRGVSCAEAVDFPSCVYTPRSSFAAGEFSATLGEPSFSNRFAKQVKLSSSK
uniref:Uncharacterized protein n=1 Tax=Physcomitrium patens TaxID=3218 RepID=A0A2K1ILU5_PHYPA|nr:hypothetical protein PHYPA_026568 [Physcomitrium patens]